MAAGLDFFGWILLTPYDHHKSVVKFSDRQISVTIRLEPTEERGERAERESKEIKETQRVQDDDVRKKQSSYSSLAPFD